jgi:hypothetical protein
MLPPEDKPIQMLLYRFMDRYMDSTVRKLYRDQLRNTKLHSERATVDDLRKHYAVYVNTLNALRMCDRSLNMSDITEEYYMSLPRTCIQYIGADYRNCSSIEEIQTKAEQALQFLPTQSSVKQDGALPRTIGLNALHSKQQKNNSTHHHNNNTRDDNNFNNSRRSSYKPSNIKNKFDPNKERAKIDMHKVICFHCGRKGHYTGPDCRLIDGPQTRAGAAAWAQRNLQRQTAYEYDKQFYINRAKEYAARQAANSQISSSSSSPSSSSSHRRQSKSKMTEQQKTQAIGVETDDDDEEENEEGDN